MSPPDPLFLILFKHRICFQPGGPFGCLQGDLPALYGNRTGRAHVHARTAVNALMVTHTPHIHRTPPDACAAAGAVFFLHPDPNERKAAEESIDRTKRAQKTAERPVTEHTGKPDHQENDPFPGKEETEHGEQAGILFIGQQPHSPFQRACRADILAECGKRQVVLQPIPKRYGQNKDCQNDIFEIRQDRGDPAFPDFRCRNAVQQFLDQAHRAQPSADRAAQDDSEEHQNAQDIGSGACSRGGCCILQRTERACTDRPGTGVTVESRHTGILHRARIDFSFHKPFQVCVVQKCAVNLRKAARRRPMRAPPGFHVSQGQYTPYRYGPP